MAQLRDFFWSDPLMGVLIAAAVIALATTPVAFIVLARYQYLRTRRGRTFQPPSFASVIVGMMLVMGIPAIFCALVVKSRHFDRNRYEFDPNRTWTVLEQGRGLRDLREADEALRLEERHLADERKKLVEGVKKLDEAMLVLRRSAAQAPALQPTLAAVLDRLGGIHKAIGLDAPQQLLNEIAPPAAIAANLPSGAGPAPTAVATPVPAPAAPASPSTGAGLAPTEVTTELAAVPEPQRPLAAMLPLTDLPAGWEVGASGSRHLETFNADNLFEKIDGRAESFLQYDVRGMAYTYYHPVGDDSNEVQLYIFEMGGPLKALGKYSSEKPEDAKAVPLGTEGYVAAGSTLFYADRYYTQIVSTRDDPKFSAFALELGKRVVAKQQPGAKPAAGTQTASESSTKAAATAEAAPSDKATPAALFALLPEKPKKLRQQFVAQDVFGYSFLSDVFMADYQEGSDKWQGFVRPYASPDEAKKVFEQYVESAKQDGAELEQIEAEGADRMVASSNIGLVDVIFRKGNTIGGANGATERKNAEAFARALAKALPAKVPAFESAPDSEPKDSQAAEAGENATEDKGSPSSPR